MTAAVARCASRSFSFAASTHVTVQPSARSHAAADANPNGWRPISYVLIRSALRTTTQALYSSGAMAVAAVAAGPHDRSFFGHPRGLSTLFFTEMWERFSYYGMRALLILFMTAPAAAGGLGFDTGVAGAVYGLYTSMVYMTSLPGGWIADRLIGPRPAVLYGALIIPSRPFALALQLLPPLYIR